MNLASKKEYEMRIKIGGRVDASLEKATKSAKENVKGIEKSISKVESNIKSLSNKDILEGLEGGLSKFENRMKTIGKVVASVTAGLAGAATVMGSNFEAQMKTVQAISGSSEAQLDILSEKAKEMGGKTVFSATEAGKALEYMAMAGWKTADMTKGISGVMNLAAASGEDLAMVSDIVTDALTAFGLKASDSAHFSDVLAAASSNSNTNVAMLGESFKYVAPVAGSLGYKVEDVAVGLGLMANQGIKAGMSGRAMKNILSNMTKPTDEMAEAMGKLGVSLTDSNGNMLSFMDIMKNLRKGFAGGNLGAKEFKESLQSISDGLEDGEIDEEEYQEKMNTLMTSMYGAGAAEKARLANMLAGKQGMTGLLAIVNSSEEDFNKLTSAIQNADGAAENMANTRLDNLQGDVKLAQSALEGLAIQVYEDSKGPMREGVQMFTKSIQDLNAYIIKSGVAKNIGRALSKGLKQMEGAGKGIIEFGKFAMKHSSVILGLLSGMAAGYATLKAVVIGNKIASGISAITMALSNPVTGAIVVGALAVSAIVGVTTALKAMRVEAGNRSLSKHFGDLSLSMKEVDIVADRLVSSKSLEGVRTAMKSFDEAGKSMDSFTNSLSAVRKLNWQVGMGIKLSDEDNAAYKDGVENMISSLKQSVTSEQYGMDTNLASILGDNPNMEGIRNSFNNYYTSVYSELDRLGEEMKTAVNDAFNDGILDIDEAKHLEELEKQMADIKAKLANDNLQSSFDTINAAEVGKLTPESFKDVSAKTAEKANDAIEAFSNSQEKALSSLHAQRKDGYLSDGEFSRQYDVITNSILDNKAKTSAMATNSLVNAIKNSYTDEIDTAIPKLNSVIENIDKNIGDTIAGVKGKYLKKYGEGERQLSSQIMTSLSAGMVTDSATKEAIKKLYEDLKPNVEKMNSIAESYREQGERIPDYVAQGLHEAATIGAMASDEASVWYLYGEKLAHDPNYEKVLSEMQRQGVKIPQELLNGLQASGVLDQAGNIVYGKINNSVQSAMATPIKAVAKFDLEAVYNISPNVLSNKARAEVQAAAVGKQIASLKTNKITGLPAYATGGIIEKPTLATFAEDGPEAAIPLDGSSHAISLWQRAGEILGTLSGKSKASGSLEKLEGTDTSGSNVVVNFSPVQNFSAGTTAEEVQRVNELSFEEFKKMFDRYVKDNRRLGFT